VGCESHTPAVLPTAITPNPWYIRMGGIQSRSGRVREVLSAPAAQPVASRRTEYATLSLPCTRRFGNWLHHVVSCLTLFLLTDLLYNYTVWARGGAVVEALKIHPNIILSSTPGSPQWSLSLRFPHQNPIHAYFLPHPRYMPRPSHSSRFYHPHNIG
jgi:hypothetical protein